MLTCVVGLCCVRFINYIGGVAGVQSQTNSMLGPTD
jgi:hypothetical protein